MKQTPETIKKRRELKLQEVQKNKDYQVYYQIEKVREKIQKERALEFEKKRNQLLRKAETFKKKKEVEYKRKCLNEIRKLEGKEQKQYKPKSIKTNQKLQIALAIQQENSRLRDTDENGR